MNAGLVEVIADVLVKFLLLPHDVLLICFTMPVSKHTYPQNQKKMT